MNNKKRAIDRANLLLEKRFLIKEQVGISTSIPDVDGNNWYVGKSPNSEKYRIYVKLKNEKDGIDGFTIESKRPELWKKVSYYKNYFKDYNSEKDATTYLNIIVKSIAQYKTTGGTAGTAGTASPFTQDDLNQSLAQVFIDQGIGRA
jgi:hypothetical protein